MFWGALAGQKCKILPFCLPAAALSLFVFPLSRSYSTKMPVETSRFLRFVKLSPKAFSPTKGSDKAAGFDIKSAYSYVIPPRSKEMVKTDLQIELPEGCYGRIAPRSGLTWKNGIDVGAGVVDEDYRGDIRVILFNHSDEPFTIQPGDRIAQLICERIYYPELQEVEELNQTTRGSGGFGSTGKN
ncbi:deoxyuridine 5'-triphosphate nucleotidohydrolase-like [Macrosteles quadrilineatus]|uniref:deoxyuridine 5'-triphosphate nucleotidohydrolase-like n=1 Tax=Macrosteles quadrilineatus TaxID=74068 RepID=UPI0023E31062|nr:deoxyuridine 5'-triphosphate nucleotidohydrolase-like [Macrosteles quadrilineatus]